MKLPGWIESAKNRLAQVEWPKRAAATTLHWIKHLELRQRLVKMLPQDLAAALPSEPNPTEIAQWLGKAFQNQGADHYLTLFTVILCTYYLADLTSLLAERFIPEAPPIRSGFSNGGSRMPTRKSINDYSIIFSRNLFNSQGIIPGEEANVEQNGAPIRSSLPLSLIGTLIFEDPNRSIATLEDKGIGTASVYPVRVDDEIPSKVKILSIETRRVIFKNLASGRKEYVELPNEPILAGNRISLGGAKPVGGGKPGIEAVGANQFNISRSEVDKTLSDLNNVLTQARAVPHFENGVPAGYKLYQIVSGSIYEKLGLQNGDTICGLNGAAMTDPGKAFEMLNELKTSSHLELCIKRDGKQSNFAYDIR